MEYQKPLITIIMPVRDRDRIVPRTLHSFAMQTLRPLHFILVDNGSTDNTAEILRKWKSDHESDTFIVDIVHESTPGASAARNKGLENVKTEYVMFFDSDDEMRPDHLKRITDTLTARPDTDILRWDVAIMDPDGWMNVKSQHWHDEMQLHLMHGTLATQRWVARTELVRKTGGWDTSLPNWNDLELGCRMLCTDGIKIRKLHGEPTVVIHPCDDSITGTSYSSRADGHRMALDRIDSILTDTARSEYLSTVSAKRAIAAGNYRKEGDRENASAMLQQAKKGHTLKERLALSAIYTSVRLFGHGGASLALFFFGKKAPKS